MKVKKAIHGGDLWKYYPVLDFSSNTNPLGPSKKAIKSLKENLWRISHYPDDSCGELKNLLSKHAGVDENNIILGNGSTEIIKSFIEAFVQAGDQVVLLSPTYSEYEYQILLRGGKITFVTPGKEVYYNVKDVIARLESNPKALILCDPNNPTGQKLKKRDLRRILEFAFEKEILVLLDEAYIDFSFETGFDEILKFNNLLVSRSLTKFYTLPGLRLGYGISNFNMIKFLEELRIPWNVNSLAQIAGIESLTDDDFAKSSMRFLIKERKYLLNNIKKVGLRTVKSDTNFFLINLEGKISSVDLKNKLLDKNILIRDCSSFRVLGLDYIRVAVKLREDNLILINELHNIMGELDE